MKPGEALGKLGKVNIDETLYASINSFNLLNKLVNSDKFKNRFYITPEKKIAKILPTGYDYNSPWVHVRSLPGHDCRMYHLLFDTFKFIPTPCLSCWKTFVRPRNIVELFKLYNVMVDLDYESKCGVELRSYVNAQYGGYFYNFSKEDGLARYREVKEVIAREISPEVPVGLKRWCTEYENELGDSNKYQQPPEAVVIEGICNELFVEAEFLEQAPVYLRNHIMSRWIERAAALGDPKLVEIAGGSINPQPVLYRINI